MEDEIYYNASEDDWSSADTSIEEVVQMMLDDMGEKERKEAKVVTLYKGVKKQQTFEDFLRVDAILDNMAELAYEECGEWAEDYLCGVSKDQKKELEKVISAWAASNNISPSWFMIEQIEEIKFQIPNNWNK